MAGLKRVTQTNKPPSRIGADPEVKVTPSGMSQEDIQAIIDRNKELEAKTVALQADNVQQKGALTHLKGVQTQFKKLTKNVKLMKQGKKASSVALTVKAGIAQDWIVTRPHVDYTKPFIYIKAFVKNKQDKRIVAHGVIPINVKGKMVDVEFTHGRFVTNDAILASEIVRQVVSCSIDERDPIPGAIPLGEAGDKALDEEIEGGK
jgi:hypothetical protein